MQIDFSKRELNIIKNILINNVKSNIIRQSELSTDVIEIINKILNVEESELQNKRRNSFQLIMNEYKNLYEDFDFDNFRQLVGRHYDI